MLKAIWLFTVQFPLQPNVFYCVIPIPVGKSDNRRIVPLIDVAYFINLLYSIALTQKHPLKESELKNGKKNSAVF